MVDWNRGDTEPIGLHLHFGLQSAQAKERRHFLGKGDEIRPHDAVKDVALYAGQRFRASINPRAFPRRRPHILDEDWQAGRVIGVGVSEEYVPDGLLFLSSAVEP